MSVYSLHAHSANYSVYAHTAYNYTYSVFGLLSIDLRLLPVYPEILGLILT